VGRVRERFSPTTDHFPIGYKAFPMLWTTIFLAVLISAGAAAYVLWPLFSRTVSAPPVEDDQLTELLSRKDGLMIAIKDLEFDYQVGKLSEEDYQRFDARLRQQAISYMQQIDKLAPQTNQLDDSLEAEIARQRKTRAASVAVNGKAAPVKMPVNTAAPTAVAVAVPAGGEVVARFCTNCGQPLASGHKFCANCGTAA